MAQKRSGIDTGERYIYQWAKHDRYVVRVTVKGQVVTRYFGFDACGGQKKAMKLAIECREDLLREIASGEFERKLYTGEPNKAWDLLGKRSKKKTRVVSQFLLWAGRDLNGKKVEP